MPSEPVHKTPPLWMPEGSVRAILAMALVGSVMVLAIRGDESQGPAVMAVVSLASAVVGFYFAVRTKEQSKGTSGQ